MSDSSEWELSKENVQPLRHGRKVASLTSALQHTPIDMQQIKDQRDVFEKQLRMNDGDDPLDIWFSYIKWTEQNFPRGGKDGNLLELLQRCLTHFRNQERYKNDSRFVQMWIKFANLSDDPLEIYSYMFDQKIGCNLSQLYEEWASFLERLGNTRKADIMYMEGISRGAQPLDVLKLKHSEFQMRVARGLTLQPREELEEMQSEEEQRTVLGRLKTDKKNHVGTTRTGSAKLSHAQPLGPAPAIPQQQTGRQFQVFHDENAPPSSAPQQTGERKTVPVREQINRENEMAPGVWTKARVTQRKGVRAAASMPAQPSFDIHEDENPRQQNAGATVIDNHVLSARKAEKPGHMLDPIRENPSCVEIPMYCKEKVYCGTQEYSFEELRALKYMEKKRKREEEEKEQRLTAKMNAMQLMQDNIQKEIETLRAEQRQLLALQRQSHVTSFQENSGSQQTPLSASGCGDSLPSAPSSSSFSLPQPSVPVRFNASLSSAPSSASFSGPVSLAQSSASFSNPYPSAPSSASFSSSSANFHKQAGSGATLQNTSLNSSQRTPVFDTSAPRPVSSGSGNGGNHHQQRQSRSGGPTPENSVLRHSLINASPTICTKEALQMVQGMYNATLECDQMKSWVQEDTEITEAVEAQNAEPVLVFDDTKQKSAPLAAIPIFCDENAPPHNRPLGEGGQTDQNEKGLAARGGRLALHPKPVSVTPVASSEIIAEDEVIGKEGAEFYSHYDITLAEVGSQDSFAAAAKSASTPFGICSNDRIGLPSVPLSCSKPNMLMRKNSEEEMMDTASASVLSSHSESQQSQHAQFRTFNNTRFTPTKNDLSPIIEGSTEGSSEESKAVSTLGVSCASSVKTSAVSTSHRNHSKKEMEACGVSASQHTIDISAYVPPEGDEKTEAVLSMSVCIDPHSPFDEDTIKNFLTRINPPLEKREGFVLCNQNVPIFSGSQFCELGADTYQLTGLIGEGGYAKVYHAICFNSNLDDGLDMMDVEAEESASCVIKVQKPASPWEYYICSEVHQRLQKLGLNSMRPNMMEITHGYFYLDGSCLVSDFCSVGSLLNLVNHIKNQREIMTSLEPLAAFITIHLLRAVEMLHRCHIIHGDIKPDNILLTGYLKAANSNNKEEFFGANANFLKLVDFGQAIDMSLYPLGTTFMAKVETSGFQCIEMMTDQPWTYQTDMFGLAGSIHVLVFGQYMKVYNHSQGVWRMTSKFQRKWNEELWKKLFHELLNIPSCDEQPDLAGLRKEFEEHFMTNLASNFKNVLATVINQP